MKLINENLIGINCELNHKEDVIKWMCKKLDSEKRINDGQKLIADVRAREEEASTSMGWGIAIPHAQSNSVKHTSLIFLKLANPIIWNEDEVSIVFGIFVPRDLADTVHLNVLASLARKLIDEDFRKELMNCENENQAMKLLKHIEDELK